MTFTRKDEERKYLSELSFLHRIELIHRGKAFAPRYIFKAIFGRYPLLLASYDNKKMRQKISKMLASQTYDLLHIEPFYVWPSIPKTCLAGRQASLPMVVAEHNIEYKVYDRFVKESFAMFRPALSFDVRKLKYWEENVWEQACHITAVSESDAVLIKQKIGSSKVSIVSNGVDLDSFPFYGNQKLHDPPVFLFVGNFTWIQNRDAIRFLSKQIWPKIKEHHPNAILRVVGRGMPDSLRQKLTDPSFIFFEDVEDISSEFGSSDVLLAPIRIGGGTKFKILEAMASGVPVVTTTAGAEGLNVKSSSEIFIADSPEKMLEAIDLIISNSKKRHELIKNARILIEKEYSWKHIAEKLDNVWEHVYEKYH